MPTRYVEVAEDEMTYLDGGYVISKSACVTLERICARGALMSGILAAVACYAGQAVVTLICTIGACVLGYLTYWFGKGASAKGLNLGWTGFSVRR